jgi:hypothetical protein
MLRLGVRLVVMVLAVCVPFVMRLLERLQAIDINPGMLEQRLCLHVFVRVHAICVLCTFLFTE